MSKFNYQIYDRAGTKIWKADGLSRHGGEEKSCMEAKCFKEVQIIVLVDDKEENTKDMEVGENDFAR